jgi:hypothetical protein
MKYFSLLNLYLSFCIDGEKKIVNVLLSGTSDIRHILKTCCDMAENKAGISLNVSFTKIIKIMSQKQFNYP